MWLRACATFRRGCGKLCDPWSMLSQIVLPAAVPSIFTGLREGLANTWQTVIAVKLFASSERLGYLMSWARQLFQRDLVLAVVVVLAAIGFARDRGRWSERNALGHSAPDRGAVARFLSCRGGCHIHRLRPVRRARCVGEREDTGAYRSERAKRVSQDAARCTNRPANGLAGFTATRSAASAFARSRSPARNAASIKVRSIASRCA
jgi:hypothetical protein